MISYYNKSFLARAAMTLLLAVTMLLTPLTAWGLSPRSGDNWNDGTKTLTVTSNPTYRCYADNTEIQHLVIADNVTSVGELAFHDCINLTSVTFNGNNLTTIENLAFAGTKLESVSFPASVTTIGTSAFNNCTNLATVTFGTGLTTIGESAFESTNLSSVSIPASVTSIGESVFYDCKSLTAISVATENQNYKAIDGVLYSKDETKLLTYPANKNATGFSFEIPSSVTSIGYGAFAHTKLTSVTIPSGVTTIGNDTFNKCTSLTSVTIPSGVKTIGQQAFYGCTSLTSITLPESLESIVYMAFAGTHLTSINIPANVTSIGDAVFQNLSSLTSVTFNGNNLTTIAGNAFYGTGLTSVNLPASVTTIDQQAFGDCTGLQSVTFNGNNLTTIGQRAFYHTGLTSIAIPASVTSIGEAAFSNCSSLTSFTVAEGNLNYKSINGSLCTTSGGVTTLIVYPTGNTATSYDIPASVTSIGRSVFEGCTSLQSVTLHEGLQTIGNNAFKGSGLTSISIPASVTSIGQYVFDDCASLQSVNFADGINLTTISWSAFNYCTSLTSVDIPTGVTTIESNAFNYCEQLTSVSIPVGVTTIGDYAFYYNKEMPSITIPNTVTSIGDFAFANCYGFTSVFIPSSVATVAFQAFYNCNNVTDVYCYRDPSTITWGSNAQFVSTTKFHAPAGSGSCSLNVVFQNDLVGTAPLTANLGDNPGEYWSTYKNATATNYKVGIDTEVYTAKLETTKVKLTKITDGIINAGAAVILKSTVPNVALLTSASASSCTDSYNDNQLTGYGEETAQTSSGTTYYVLNKGSHGVGYYKLAANVPLAANKAFFAVSSGGARTFYGFDEDDSTTDISKPKLSSDEGAWFSLDGRKISGKPAHKGIYVKNGSKYVVK